MQRELVLGLTIAILWGIRPVLQKQVLNSISPSTVMTIGAFLYLILVSVYVLLYHKTQFVEEVQSCNTKQITILVLVAGVGFIASVMYYRALSDYTASKIVTITSIWPLFAIIFAGLILEEKIDPNLIIVVLALIGSIMYFEKSKKAS